MTYDLRLNDFCFREKNTTIIENLVPNTVLWLWALRSQHPFPE